MGYIFSNFISYDSVFKATWSIGDQRYQVNETLGDLFDKNIKNIFETLFLKTFLCLMFIYADFNTLLFVCNTVYFYIICTLIKVLNKIIYQCGYVAQLANVSVQ